MFTVKYTVFEGVLYSPEATVTITVLAGTKTPVARDDADSVTTGGTPESCTSPQPIGAATGGGSSNYTGSYSGTASARFWLHTAGPPSTRSAEPRPSPLLVIVPRDQGGICASLAAEFEVVPGCRVIMDRRLAERRRVARARAAEERRGGDRRAGQLESSQGLVVLVR